MMTKEVDLREVVSMLNKLRRRAKRDHMSSLFIGIAVDACEAMLARAEEFDQQKARK